MGGLHSRNKGKQGERDVRDLFRKALEEFMPDTSVIRRNHQQAEIGGADLVGVPWLSVEIKRVKKIGWGKELEDWWEQCVEACDGYNQRPVLVFRQDHGSWLVMYQAAPLHIVNNESQVIPMIVTWVVFEKFLKQAMESPK